MNNSKEISYRIVRSNRRTVSLEVTPSLEILVRAPARMSVRDIEAFVEKNSAWIERAVARMSSRNRRMLSASLSDEECERLRALAKLEIPPRVEHFSRIMGLTPSSVKITSAKGRFGSCSGRNGLCFSFRLMCYPPEAIDYVVVHELAHIRHHDHSDEFYSLIEKYLPDYKEREKLLRS